MAKSSSTNQANLLNRQKSVMDIIGPLGWKRVPGTLNGFRLDHSDREFSYLNAIDELAEYFPEPNVWRAGRIRLDESGTVEQSHSALTKAKSFEEALAYVAQLALARPAFTPLEALRNLVLFHDGDADFLAANRATIADMPFGETSFQESLWQVARDIVKGAGICAARPRAKTEEPQA